MSDKSPKIITVTNQKGGVGKTTTVINLGASLAAAEKKTLLLDLDPQGNAGSGLGVDKLSLTGKTIYNVLVQERKMSEVIIKTELDGLDIVPSNQDLIGAEVELVTEIARETRLKVSLEEILPLYDYILIDCPPSLGLLTINALTASDSYLVPMQCEYYAMEGLSQLVKLVGLVNKSLNPKLSQEGILLTMFDSRNNLCHQVAAEIREHFKGQVFQSVIPRNVKLSECPSHGKPILLYDVNSKGAMSYLSLAKEIIQRNEIKTEATLDNALQNTGERPLQINV
ncbi:MAG: chromosome partitioning protein ParA [Deltaproteobacteria bacterium GWA2_38_16]|nr:MAG: chromosome partitioning protein ParA [Deltaproteobacteria bacterium GWA2_38_16]OGQ01765.1 MAG: chromosome partitioning protein ParA [Deltaproteobacteria bacterium RIFCSPHIGHO2_02_FULL_38_15]OGQ33443.1 MAG: chromosome partitioning protein ParA [Deltaproteobacteria bacterium RIFCSPLOWO2_01_FULL_38_9]OGQ59437.1 MAG: chromosome partitioning protein ParA [Deltaproteobacteria bacterium RIFCSPLOWO2_12_FULL_38_8]HBQ21432.1 chromosome partitioning protein ParA [Deltaproteobacteria bacterium]